MESIKLSKKELIKRGEQDEGYYFTGNCYSYENVANYLEQLSWRTEKGHKTQNAKRIKEIKEEIYKNTNKDYFNSAQDIIESIERTGHDSYSLRQLYYSAGLYGNSGQLHQLKLYKNGKTVASYILYY